MPFGGGHDINVDRRAAQTLPHRISCPVLKFRWFPIIKFHSLRIAQHIWRRRPLEYRNPA
ncbi:MAG: hypothetical protein CM15mP21_0560 [Hyphomicrobiales bacterium]|nr:MAG: hypothetical protein CM15mP21_0560 [Hyphomicrobiales bacterium]